MPRSTKNDVLIVAVLDESGSMSGVTQEVKHGFNALIDDQLAERGNTYVTLATFNSKSTVRYVAERGADMAPLGSPTNPYRPAGGTALYDAVGAAIEGTSRWLNVNKWFKGKVIVVVWTDGGENCSQEFKDWPGVPATTAPWINNPGGPWRIDPWIVPKQYGAPTSRGIDRLNAMIESKKEAGWVFQFMGSGESAWLAGKAFTAINHQTYLHNTSDSYTRAYTDSSNSISAFRASGAYTPVASDVGGGV